MLVLPLVLGWGCSGDAARTRSAPDDSGGAAAPAPATADSTGARADTVQVVQANHGTHGMSARVLTLRSPDGRAMLVMEDPTAVEAEPIANGFVYADERTGAWLQMDGVWDVTPSPDWRTLAIGRAFRLGSGEREVPRSRWRDLARRLGPAVARQLFPDAPDDGTAVTRLEQGLHERRFSASGMAIMYGNGVTFVLATDSLPRGASGAAVHVPADSMLGRAVALHGWRERWTSSGDVLGVGTGPRGSQDFSPPASWVLLRRPSWDSVGVAGDSARFVSPRWEVGPMLDISVAVDLNEAVTVPAEGARVGSRDGWVFVQRRGDTERRIGPGRALAATRDGRFVAALAPRADTARYESPTILVVYRVN